MPSINSFTGVSNSGSGSGPLKPTSDLGNAPDTALLRGTVADILGLQSKASIDAADAAASDIQAAGYGAEVDAYSTVQGIAGNNATVAKIAGDIKLLQQNRALRETLGSQKADVAAAGFGNSGSSLDLMRSSVQQGALTRQLTNIQTAQTVGGYLEEGAAAGAEVAGANMASAAARALAVQQRASGELATANAANETAALQTYLKGTTPTPESALVTSTLAGTPGAPAVFNPATVAPAPSFNTGDGAGGNATHFGNLFVR